MDSQARHESQGVRFYLRHRGHRDGLRSPRDSGERAASQVTRADPEAAPALGCTPSPPALHGPWEVTLADGTRLPPIPRVEAVGSLPNVAWLYGNGLDLADGVCCDNRLAMAAARRGR